YMKNDVDILLCFDLPAERIAHEGPITAVDRTIHHSEYVASRLNRSLREDVRILKSFVRASHAYGDTCAVGHMGFTGISLELLVIQKSGLMSALESLVQLEREPLDPLKRSQNELKGISTFKDDCVFIIDPTDPNRNIAASFSRRAYCWIRNRVKELITDGLSDDKILDLIIEKQIPVSRPPEWIEDHLLIYEIIADTEKHYTIVRDKLHRFANRIARGLMYERTGERRFGQVTFEIYIENERFSVGFLVENPEISQCYTRRGPPSNIPGASQFKIAHPDSYEREGYLWIEGRRRWVKAKEMLDHLITTNLPDGMEICPEMTDVGLRLANVLYQIVLPLERFPIKARV
ncbi:MAG: hypothetical protein JW779_12125, partial [Candidatus Thorarchaeota archaeon]|nr:hypothetical protein [Candidatus Thorarchaeota archaeon]